MDAREYPRLPDLPATSQVADQLSFLLQSVFSPSTLISVSAVSEPPCFLSVSLSWSSRTLQPDLSAVYWPHLKKNNGEPPTKAQVTLRDPQTCAAFTSRAKTFEETTTLVIFRYHSVSELRRRMD